jgi:hypothetical protein
VTILVFCLLAAASPASGGETAHTARLTVSVTASGEDATRSGSDWSRGTFRYHARFTVDRPMDGV